MNWQVNRNGKKIATFELASEVWLFFRRVTDYTVVDCHRGGYTIHKLNR